MLLVPSQVIADDPIGERQTAKDYRTNYQELSQLLQLKHM